jgi:Contractile injection system tube protein
MDTEQRQVLRGFLARVDTIPPLILTFQFNPSSISDNKKVSYADRAGSLSGNAPDKKYTGGGQRTITFDLKLHGLEQGTNRLNPTPVDNGISTELAKLRSFLYPKENAWAPVSKLGEDISGKALVAPPNCYFGFGTKILECIVTDIKITETQFNSMLAPVRADVSVTLDVVEAEDNPLYQLDTQRRNALALLGLQNLRVV